MIGDVLLVGQPVENRSAFLRIGPGLAGESSNGTLRRTGAPSFGLIEAFAVHLFFNPPRMRGLCRGVLAGRSVEKDKRPAAMPKGGEPRQVRGEAQGNSPEKASTR